MKILGPKSDALLADIGLTSLDQLRELGVEETFRMLKSAHPEVTLNFLWGLEAAVAGIDWRDIDDARKRELRRALADILPPS